MDEIQILVQKHAKHGADLGMDGLESGPHGREGTTNLISLVTFKKGTITIQYVDERTISSDIADIWSLVIYPLSGVFMYLTENRTNR